VDKVVVILDPKKNLSYRYVVTADERTPDQWLVKVVSASRGRPHCSVLLPHGARRLPNEQEVLELAWDHVREQHPGLNVPPPREWFEPATASHSDRASR
jgi:hypothetical protein